VGSPYRWKGGRGWVLDSLALAVGAMVSGLNFERALVKVVNMGADSDTNGAIAGGLLGARDGVRAIPERWLAKLEYRRAFEAMANEFSS
jgi:ADP-ribosylglycohydrolase